MKLLAVRQARVICTLSLEELNPKGRAIFAPLLAGLIERYRFTGLPDSQEPPDGDKPTTLRNGVWGDIALDTVTIFPNFMAFDTSSSTKDSEAIFEDAIKWGVETFGLTFSPEMISRKAYLSEIVFQSEKSLNALNPAFEKFGKSISKALKKSTGRDHSYETAGIGFHYDISEVKTSFSPFRVERLEGSKYFENKYYSASALETEDHLRLLEEFESIMN